MRPLNQRPLFSCVVPVKGPRPYFEAAMQSLLAQGMGGDLEIIVQDGDVEPDQGLSDALNQGFAKAQGEWLFWLNADDVLLPGVLNRIVRTIKQSNNSLAWIAGNTVYIDKDGKGMDARWNRRWHPFLYRHLPVWTGGPSAFFRRELWERVGGFDLSLKYMMDIDLWTRMARAGAKYVVPDFLVWGFRWHAGSLTAGGQHQEEMAAESRRLCAKFGFRHQRFWRMMMRLTQLVDGSFARRRQETRRAASFVPAGKPRILHLVPGLEAPNNGIAVAAKLIAREQAQSGDEVEVMETRQFLQSNNRTIEQFSEVWVHSLWRPQTMLACWKVLRAEKRLVRMTHGNLDPLRLRYHGWKKRLAGPVERWLLRRCDRIVATCAAEQEWIRAYVGKRCPEMVVEDLKRFFDLSAGGSCSRAQDGSLHLLYLGRRHPLKGLAYLEQAVAELAEGGSRTVELRIVSDHFGEELEKDWEWCEVLVLPTLSENFGLVVAEALARGKQVITTDGAPAWEPGERLVYLRGYREGTDEERVRLLTSGIKSYIIRHSLR